MEQGPGHIWCSFCIAITAFVGCEQLNDTQSGNKELDPHAVRSPTTTDPPDRARVLETAATRMFNLEVEVSGFVNSNGTCRVAVYLGQSHFNEPKFAIAKESIQVIDLKSTWQVQIAIPEECNRDVDSDTGLAVSAYHDENDNSRLDKNAFGIPTERYGFSKNPKRGYGPPKFSETAIEWLLKKQISDPNAILVVPIQIK